MAFGRRLLFTICACAALTSMPALAQSDRAFLTDQSRHSKTEQSSSPASRTPPSGTRTKSAGTTPTLGAPPSGLSFAAAVGYGSGGNGGNSIAVADLNGDGYPDLVVADWCATSACTSGNVAVLLGNGDGTFQPAVSYASGGLFADSVAIADLRGNGKLDLIVGNCASNGTICVGAAGGVGVLLGNGDGTFQVAVAYSTTLGVAAVAVADVNGDGKLDLLIATNCGSSGSYSGCAGVLLGDGTGKFANAITYSSGAYGPLAIAVGDVNGDGKPDLVVAHCGASICGTGTGNVGVLLNNGDGTFAAGVLYAANGIYSDGVAIADVNGDGKADVVVANSSTSLSNLAGNLGVLLGNGDGTFQAAVAYPSGGFGAAAVAVADMNGDGKLDLVVANCSSTTGACTPGNSGSVGAGVLLGNGDGTFQPVLTYGSGGSTPFGVAVADLNHDTKPDIVIANCAGGNCGAAGLGAVGVLLNTSLGGTSTTLTSSPNPADFGATVTFTATVISGFKGTPTGSVNFLNTINNVATNIGSSPLNGSDVATLSTSTLAAGNASITATYIGDTNFVTSTSSVLTQSVQGVSTTTLSVSPGTVAFGTSVTLAAKVSSTAGTPANGETVTFKDATSSATLGTGTLASGTATLTSTTIPAGTYSVVASYPGDTNTMASVSSAQTLNVQNFTLSANPKTVTVSAPGQPGSTTITVTTKGSLSAQSLTNWGCSGLPALTTCSFGAVNSTDQSTVTISTTGSADLRWPASGHHQGLFYAMLLPGLLGVVTITGRKRKLQILQTLAMIAVLSFASAWLGCASTSSKPSTPAGTSTVTVSATSGTLKASTTFTLTVQ